MSNREYVLVVDEFSDTAEVLQAVLEPRGVTVNRICRWGQTEFPTAEIRPTIVVCHSESLAEGALSAGGSWHGVPQIIIGTIGPPKSNKFKSDTGNVDTTEQAASDLHRRYLQKPFQFAELMQAIEALIAPRAA